MRLVIHAGLNKTGSSSLQSYLHHVRPALAEAGVLYPDLGARAHWRIAAELAQRGGGREAGAGGYLGRLADRDGVGDALDTLAGLIRQHRNSDQVMLISQENFGTLQTMTRLRKFVRQVDPALTPTVMAYAREPASLFQSSVQHNVKAGKSYFHPLSWTSQHHVRVKGLRKVCGDDLKLRCFSSKTLTDGDVIADFRDWFRLETGRDLPEAGRSFGANSALSAQGCALLVEAQEDPSSPLRDIPDLRKKISGFDGPYATRSKLALPVEWQRLLRSRLGAEWNAIVDTMDSPDEVKARARVDVEPVEADVAPDAVTRWLLGYATPEYRGGLLAHLARRPSGKAAGNRGRRRSRPSSPLPGMTEA
jgi:hypothetical protein